MPFDSLTNIPTGAIAGGAAAENTVLSTPALNVGPGVAVGIVVWGFLTITLGTAATGVQLRLRQATGNAQVDSTVQVNAAAGSLISVPFAFNDTSPSYDDSGAAQYILTVQQIAATGAGNIQSGKVMVEV